MTDDLAQFLRDRLDEDEEAARNATTGPWWVEDTSPRYWGEERDAEVSSADGRLAVLQHENDGALNAVHIVRWDPARVLADMQAKRRIVALHSDPHGGDPSCSSIDYPENAEDCETLRLLALPYASHPDYRPEWAPDA